MSALHLVRIGFDLRALVAFAVAERANDDDGGYAAHLALRRRYGPAAPQPFRLREEGPGGPHLVGYATDPAALAEAHALPALDERLAHIFAHAPDCRAMPETWRTGARYMFEVRVRPVVRFGGRVRAARAARPDAWQAGAGEVDAFVAACERAQSAPIERAAVYRDWLAGRLADAAALERAELVLYRRLRTRRSSHGRPGARTVESSEAVFRGTLRVGEPAAFARLLAGGVGRHAAFGFGMLLLAPPGPA